jgi:hypothetical protein
MQDDHVSSSDGGKSAASLATHCQNEAIEVSRDCARRTGGESKLCESMPVLLAQVALGLLGK